MIKEAFFNTSAESDDFLEDNFRDDPSFFVIDVDIDNNKWKITYSTYDNDPEVLSS